MSFHPSLIRIVWLWPFVSLHRYQVLQTENFTLRDALREAHGELLRHRTLIAGLRTGQSEMTRAVERALR